MQRESGRDLAKMIVKYGSLLTKEPVQKGRKRLREIGSISDNRNETKIMMIMMIMTMTTSGGAGGGRWLIDIIYTVSKVNIVYSVRK
jgi:hypothetical protein